MDFSLSDVVFQLGNVTVALVQNYEQTNWPGLVIHIVEGDHGRVYKAPLDVTHAVQLCAFNFASLCKKIESQQDMIIELKAKVAEKSESAEILPFKPKGI